MSDILIQAGKLTRHYVIEWLIFQAGVPLIKPAKVE